jgi:hypothetical protein
MLIYLLHTCLETKYEDRLCTLHILSEVPDDTVVDESSIIVEKGFSTYFHSNLRKKVSTIGMVVGQHHELIQ